MAQSGGSTYKADATATGAWCGFDGYRVGCYCGNEARIDCTQMAGKKICNPTSDKFAICVDAGNQCGDNLQDTCEGNSLVYCVDGYKTRTDCSSLGFKTCGALEINGNRLGSLCK